MRSSSGAAPPAVCASFNRLYQKAFDHKHNYDEADRIAQYPRHVEQREGRAEDESDAIRTSEQFDHQHDLPDDRKDGTRAGRQIGRELRDYDMPDPRQSGELKGFRHFLEFGIERAGSLAHHDGDVWQFVDYD